MVNRVYVSPLTYLHGQSVSVDVTRGGSANLSHLSVCSHLSLLSS